MFLPDAAIGLCCPAVTATDTTTLDKLCVDTIRTLSMDAVQKANSGHPGTPMALAPIAYVLYARVMRHSPRHRFGRYQRHILSAEASRRDAPLQRRERGPAARVRRPE